MVETHQSLHHLKNAISNTSEATLQQALNTAAALQANCSPSSISRLDRQKLIDQCEQEVQIIESEFDLLTRKDFVEFVH